MCIGVVSVVNRMYGKVSKLDMVEENECNMYSKHSSAFISMVPTVAPKHSCEAVI